MRRILWVFGWVGVALWSLLALAVYGTLDMLGNAAMRNADVFSSDPDTVEWIWQAFSWMRGLSTSFTLVVWGIVSLAILSVPWLFGRLMVRVDLPPGLHPGYRPAPPDGVIDLAPGDYVVRRPDERGRPGPVPHIRPDRG